MTTTERLIESRSSVPPHAHAIYAGSFDPITSGHLSVLRRACSLFEQVTVLVAINPEKRNAWFSPLERVRLIRRSITVARLGAKVRVAHTDGFVAHFAAERDAGFLVRGVRDVTDADAELKLARLNHQLAPNVETLFLPARGALTEVSSSKLKALALDHSENLEALLKGAPEPVVAALIARAPQMRSSHSRGKEPQ